MTNDLTTDRLRGRTNALSSICFQLPMVIAPPISGWLIGHHHGTTYVVGLIAGCGLTALLALTRLEPQLSRRANGLPELEAGALVAPPVAGTT
jgi:predicted MFS family arabinose efflux permease